MPQSEGRGMRGVPPLQVCVCVLAHPLLHARSVPAGPPGTADRGARPQHPPATAAAVNNVFIQRLLKVDAPYRDTQ